MRLPQSSSFFPARIVLVGFMGAGKSTIGPLLAQRLGWRFADSDHRIEEKTGARIADLFSSLGEAEFRKIEAEVIADLHGDNDLVLALGGGAMESESTRSMIAEASETCVVFLKAPLDILIARCEQQPGAAVRPVLNQRELLDQRFQARQRHYESAHITVDTLGESPAGVVDSILSKVQEYFSLLASAEAKVATI